MKKDKGYRGEKKDWKVGVIVRQSAVKKKKSGGEGELV